MDYVGRTILGYHLVKQLGKGSFASVYLGERVLTKNQANEKEQVAIKIFNDGSNFQEIRDEAEKMARLAEHPHIVRVLPISHDQQGRPNYVGRDESQRLFLMMGFAPHGSLRIIMRQNQPFLLRAVVEYVKQLASALQAIHDADMIHRDVKPGNILLSEDNTLLVTDFGIARDLVGGVYETLNVTGTMGYMGPEQLRGSPTARSDQYALAVITYELLTCKKPIEEEEGAGLLYQIEKVMNALPPHPMRWNPHIPPAVDAVIMRGLEKDENLRFPSVMDFAHDLDEAAQGRVPKSISLSQVPPAQAAASLDAATSRSFSRVTVPFGTTGGGTTTGGARVGLCVLPHEIQRIRWVSRYGADGSELVVITKERPPALDTTIHLCDPSKRQPSISYLLNNGELSPNGAYVARPVGETVEVHDLQAQRLVVTYKGHTGAIKKIAWSPDSKYIASTGEDHTIQVWEAWSGNLLNVLWDGIYHLHGATVTAMAWPLSGERIASYDQDGSLQMWNAIKGEKIIDASERLHNITFIEWQPTLKSRYILLSTNENIRLWDTDNNVLKTPYQLDRLDQRLVRWSPDGQYLAASTNEDEVTVWSVEEHAGSETGLKTVVTCKCKSSVYALTWAPSGGVLAIGEAGFVEIWSSQLKMPIFVYEQHIRKVTALDWSPDGRLIASGGPDKQVHVWRAGIFIPEEDPGVLKRIIVKARYLSKAIRKQLGKRKTREMLILAVVDAILPWFVTAALPVVWIPLSLFLPYLVVGLVAYQLWRWKPQNTKPALGKWLTFLVVILLAALWASASWAVGTSFFQGSCLLPICAIIGLGFGLQVHRRVITTLNHRLKPKR